MTYTTDEQKAVNAMATPADRQLAVEAVNESIRRWKLCQKLSEQAEAWAERLHFEASVQEIQQIKQESNVSQT